MNANWSNKTASIIKILVWMLTFLICYIPLLAVVIAAAACCVYGIIYAIGIIIDDNVVGGILLLLLCAALGIFLVIPILISTFRPFFVLYRSGRDERIEITESDAPELVQLVYKLADSTKNKRPKHIFVSAAANACVFFNSRFINIFFPVRKNIEIGLGLFKGLTTGELAACLSHEFGHFSQGNMRWGSVIHILNALITNVMGLNDRWNSAVNKLINFPWIIGGAIIYSLAVKAVGWILYGLTIGYMSIMDFLYEKIQLSYLELSRKMEFEADAVSARTAGTKNAISFMYKLLEISDRTDVFQRMLLRLANRNLTISDYWKTYNKVNIYLSGLTHKEISSTETISNPLSLIADKKLIVDNIYSTHPDWQNRINEIKKTDFSSQLDLSGSAENLVPDFIWEKVGDQILDDINKNVDPNREIVVIEEGKVQLYIEKELYWYQYMPYFQREVLEFDYTDCQADDKAFTPDDDSALMTISRFEAAKSDFMNANAIHEQNIKIKQLLYDGVRYTRKNIPMDQIQNEYQQTRTSAQEIDRSICKKALAGADDKNTVQTAYSIIFYAQKYLIEYSNIITPRLNKVITILNKSASDTNSHQFQQIQDSLEDFRSELYAFLYNHTDLKLIESIAPQNVIDSINDFGERRGMFIGSSISGDAINFVISLSQWLKDAHEDLLSRSKMIIIDACIGYKHIPIISNETDDRLNN